MMGRDTIQSSDSIAALSHASMNILQFALRDRWIVTVESERVLVNIRHRTRWYAVERRCGYEDRAHWCDSQECALWLAEQLREGYAQQAQQENDPTYQWFSAWYDQQTESVKAELRKGMKAKLRKGLPDNLGS